MCTGFFFWDFWPWLMVQDHMVLDSLGPYGPGPLIKFCSTCRTTVEKHTCTAPGAVYSPSRSLFDLKNSFRWWMVHQVQDHKVIIHKSRPKSPKSVVFTVSISIALYDRREGTGVHVVIIISMNEKWLAGLCGFVFKTQNLIWMIFTDLGYNFSKNYYRIRSISRPGRLLKSF